jgi:DNA-binding CsgD family transcriptional regulator
VLRYIPRVDGLSIDVGSWPLVRVRFPERVGDAEIDRLLEHVESFLASGERHAIVADALLVKHTMSPRQLARLTHWTNERRAAIADRTVGTAIVFRAAIARGVLAAYNWMIGGCPIPQTLVDTAAEADRWCLTKLAMAGVRLDRASGARSSGLPPRADVSRAEHLPAVVRRVVETHGPVVDMFREPAFLVDAQGATVYANDAARIAYAAPPSWLGAALSDGPRSSFPESRIMELGGGAGDAKVYLVIPCPSLSPALQAAAASPGLSPALERIASLLARGLADKDIATELALPLATVRTYVTRIYRRLGVSRRAEFVRHWRDLGRS